MNCNKMMFDGVGEYDIPMIQPIAPDELDLSDVEFISFNYALSEKHPENKIVHFYVDDYQFERLWSTPDRYLNLLSKFRAVLSPDFSIYTDFPKCLQIYNHYRKHWLAAYWQDNGIKVIPTICWGDENSWEWCLDGTPKHSVLSTSAIGCFNSKKSREDWKYGYRRFVEELEPKMIIIYGKEYEETKLDDLNYHIPILYVKNKIIDKFRIMDLSKNPL